ncbi:hypothetical protein Q31b_11840 [Novipirellula aureliae]|uniref:Competence protein A n=2 Tax=Novipirellula aureliae TaxID=2527966 RepID=A0A5C6EEM7_9BACT|nr:hypothetical protein Q31b_11840 [Novipirellula aureliae]
MVTSWDQANVYFLVVKERKDSLTATAWGTVQRDSERPPLALLKEYLDEHKIHVARLLLLLPRTDLEMTTVEVPPAEDAEVAALVRAEVEQLIGDGDHELVVDYRLLEGATPAPLPQVGDTDTIAEQSDDALGERLRSHSAVAFSMEHSELEAWEAAATELGLPLTALTSRQTAPLLPLGQQRVFRAPLSVLIVVYEGEVELSFLRGSRLASLRTFRAGSHEISSLTEQIQLEVQRSMSLMDFVTPGESPEWLLLTRSPLDHAASEDDDAMSLCEALDARSVSLTISMEPGMVDRGQDAMPAPDPVLIGAANAFLLDRLSVDLTNPKLPPVPPNPMLRWGAIGGFAAASIALVAYTLYADVRDLATKVSEKQQELVEVESVANKVQEKADETRFVEQWLADQVDWLSQLQRLSSLFPEGQLANVRRLSAAVDGSTGVFDLSIQVNDPSRVAELENRLRDAGFSITSKRISEQANNTEYPWQFEARIAFAILPLDERESTFVLPTDQADESGKAMDESVGMDAETEVSE